jgi:hypothetical protein
VGTKGVISYSTGPMAPDKRGSNTVYYLATRTELMQFYLFEEPEEDGTTPWTLIDRLDRRLLQGAGDKATAKVFAARLGLTSWTYVRI